MKFFVQSKIREKLKLDRESLGVKLQSMDDNAGAILKKTFEDCPEKLLNYDKLACPLRFDDIAFYLLFFFS